MGHTCEADLLNNARVAAAESVPVLQSRNPFVAEERAEWKAGRAGGVALGGAKKFS